ncbi:hypothetical protein FHL15_009309 [Xylaria flabelliformis]|uniref:Uncharacterized protein n=1 Tax=Xylaria flabelliformis TaxID=2512241 RepID=A0A553HPJ5_9PEZI|nr:hypothetical protein FHL15_009309 [Xylaria flabelliformis]
MTSVLVDQGIHGGVSSSPESSEWVDVNYATALSRFNSCHDPISDRHGATEAILRNLAGYYGPTRLQARGLSKGLDEVALGILLTTCTDLTPDKRTVVRYSRRANLRPTAQEVSHLEMLTPETSAQKPSSGSCTEPCLARYLPKSGSTGYKSVKLDLAAGGEITLQ